MNEDERWYWEAGTQRVEIPHICPQCVADLRVREHPGYFRTIAVYDRKDATMEWKCPDCGHCWPR